VYEWLDLSNNFINNPKALLRKNGSRTASSSSATPPTNKPFALPSSDTIIMAKSLYDYSTSVVDNMLVGPAVNIGNENFKFHTGLIKMIQVSHFHGLPHEDVNTHLQHFLELCDTIIIKDLASTSIEFCIFPFYLAGNMKQWFYKSKEAVNTWDKCSTACLVKFFPLSKTSALRREISNF